jgi:hypothetical protein
MVRAFCVNATVLLAASVLLVAQLWAQTSSSTPTTTPWPPKYTLRFLTLPETGAVAVIFDHQFRCDHQFRSVPALKEFIATLPPRARLVFTFGPDGTRPEWGAFINAFPDLKEFCASKGMTFEIRTPDW